MKCFVRKRNSLLSSWYKMRCSTSMLLLIDLLCNYVAALHLPFPPFTDNKSDECLERGRWRKYWLFLKYRSGAVMMLLHSGKRPLFLPCCLRLWSDPSVLDHTGAVMMVWALCWTFARLISLSICTAHPSTSTLPLSFCLFLTRSLMMIFLHGAPWPAVDVGSERHLTDWLGEHVWSLENAIT